MAVEEHKAVVRRYFEQFHNQRDMAMAPEIFLPDEVEPVRGLAAMLRAAFPDYQVRIQHMVAEGDTVATVWEGRGTHEGEWQSPLGAIPASGKTVMWTGTTTLRIANGRIVEVLGTNWDHLGILQQMGRLPAVAPRSGA
jgi:predicted ester cyclase